MRDILAFIFLTCVALVTAQDSSGGPIASTKNGTYQGAYLPEYGEEVFLGVPFAQPPLGQLRFDLPQSLNTTWTGNKLAQAYYPECVGYGGDQDGYNVSEDCLALNIVRPSGYENQSLPVGVWIHGGGFVMGGAPDRRYNLSFIVQNSVAIGQPIIGVSIAYRLSAWGFLDSAETRAAGATNLGIRDQRLALHWIQENIGGFGGDPTQVTIWGESAGSISVGIHLIAYGGRDDNLFRGAIGESGNAMLSGGYNYNISIGQAIYDNITQTAGCANSTSSDTLACLRAASFETLNNAINVSTYDFNPIEDGDIVRGSQVDQLENGNFVKVPLLLGQNLDEGSAFGPQGINNDSDFRNYLIKQGITNETTLAILAAVYPNVPESLDVEWHVTTTPNTTYGIQLKRAFAIGGDLAMHAGRRLQCQSWSKQNVTAYCYRFATVPYPYSTFAPGPFEYAGASHFQEVAFVFNNLNGYGYELHPGFNPFQDEPQSYLTTSKLMSNMWASFIATLDPNNHGMQEDGIETWPTYNVWVNASGGPATGSGQFYQFNANDTAGIGRAFIDDYRAAGIAFINTIWKTQLGR